MGGTAAISLLVTGFCMVGHGTNMYMETYLASRHPHPPTLRGWAINVLNEAGAIRECEEHGWMQDRADPHARERAFDIAREDPPPGVSPQSAAVAIAEVLDSIGDTCPECPPPD